MFSLAVAVKEKMRSALKRNAVNLVFMAVILFGENVYIFILTLYVKFFRNYTVFYVKLHY